MPSKKHKRHRVLLDEGLPPRDRYPNLNKLHNVRHIKHDFHKEGISDTDVYDVAIKENRLVVVFNAKDFKKIVERKIPSVLLLSAKLSNEQVDKKLCKVFKNIKPHQEKGYIIYINLRKNIKIISSSSKP